MKNQLIKMILIFVLAVAFIERIPHHLKSRLASVASETTMQCLLKKHKRMFALNTIWFNEEIKYLRDVAFMQHLLNIANS